MLPRISCICLTVAAFVGQSSAWSASKHISGTFSPCHHHHRMRVAGRGPPAGQEMLLSATVPASASSKTAMEESSKKTRLRTLYPQSNATNNGTLEVDSMHTLYYEQYNDATHGSLNALFLHGGPGAGCFPNHARFFSPDHYHVTLLDQRGCGRSTPKGETINNTLANLVQDIESLRIHLGYDRWDVVLGGSWGTTLALAYAQTYPERVGGMVLRGVCLFRQSEIDWLFARNGASNAKLNTKKWNEFEKAVGIDAGEMTSKVNGIGSGKGPNRDALNRYYDCLLGSDPALRVSAMGAWMKWEMSVFSLNKRENENKTGNSDSPLLVWNTTYGWLFHDEFGPTGAAETDALATKKAQSLRRFSSNNALEECFEDLTQSSPRALDDNAKQFVDARLRKLPPNMTEEQAKAFVPAQAMLTCYYSTNVDYVMGKYRNLLSAEGLERLANIPCIAVQGGEDAICPPDSALDLVQAWPEVELRIPLGAGHSMYHPEICSELIKATDRFAGIENSQFSD